MASPLMPCRLDGPMRDAVVTYVVGYRFLFRTALVLAVKRYFQQTTPRIDYEVTDILMKRAISAYGV